MIDSARAQLVLAHKRSAYPCSGWLWHGCAWLSVCVLPAPCVAADQFVRINSPEGGFPPYLFLHPVKEGRGLMVDVLESLMAPLGYRVEVVEAPRKRVELMLDSDQLDVAPRAKEWVQRPERYIFSDPVIKVRESLFGRSGHAPVLRSVADLSGKVVSTQFGYIYPNLQDMFEHGAKRDDSFDVRSGLRKVLVGHSDVASMVELTGLWLIKAEGWDELCVYKTLEVGTYDYRFMFTRRFQGMLPQLNKELEAMKEDGRMAAIVARYIPNRQFSKCQ